MIKNNDEAIATYAATLADSTDQEIVADAAKYCWLSAYAANNPRSIYHEKCDAVYEEANRRGKPWLYQRGWNQAYEESGYCPSENDLKLAQVPQGAAEGQQSSAVVE